MGNSDKPKRPFSIILFDLGNVLVQVDYAAFLRTMNFAHLMTEGELSRLLEVDSRAYETGKVTAEEFLSVINTKLQSSYTLEQFSKAWISILPSPVKGVPELVEHLASNHRLMLLSNTNELHFRHMIEMLPVLRHFERSFLSYEIGVLKPDPVIYKYVLSHVDVPAERLLFIDDLDQNILAARNAGMSGILFRGAEALQEELKRLKAI